MFVFRLVGDFVSALKDWTKNIWLFCSFFFHIFLKASPLLILTVFQNVNDKYILKFGFYALFTQFISNFLNKIIFFFFCLNEKYLLCCIIQAKFKEIFYNSLLKSKILVKGFLIIKKNQLFVPYFIIMKIFVVLMNFLS